MQITIASSSLECAYDYLLSPSFYFPLVLQLILKYRTQVDIKKYREGWREGGLKAVILFLSLGEEDDDFMERCVWEGRIGLDFRVQLFFYLSFGFRRDHPLINVNQKHGKPFQSFCLSPILHFFYCLNLCCLNF